MLHKGSRLIESYLLFLKSSRLSDQTIRSYRCIVEKFLAENPGAVNFTYSDILFARLVDLGTATSLRPNEF
ncbi:MAG TPA: hypothetical protein PK610_13735, partial [Flavobacteriales bacterium]|nr:hypothetical protein [Flavobacteriales bacterium]